MSQHGPETPDPSDPGAPQPNPWQHGADGRAEPTSPYGTPPPYAQPPEQSGGYPSEQYPAGPYQTGPYQTGPHQTGPHQTGPYETSPYPASAYGVPYGGFGAYGPAPQQHPQATTALILGILGLMVCPPVGIGGFVLGGRARRAIAAEPQRYTGSGMATAGWVLGIISIIETVLVVASVVLVLLGVVNGSGF